MLRAYISSIAVLSLNIMKMGVTETNQATVMLMIGNYSYGDFYEPSCVIILKTIHQIPYTFILMMTNQAPQ